MFNYLQALNYSNPNLICLPNFLMQVLYIFGEELLIHYFLMPDGPWWGARESGAKREGIKENGE